MATNEVKGFSFYRSYFEALGELDIDDQKELLLSIVNYVFLNEEPEYKTKDIKKMAWYLIKPNLDKSKNKSNGNAGAPKGNQNARKYEIEETNEKQSNFNQTHQDKSLSLSISNSLSYIIINNNKNKDNIYNLFEEYINIRLKNKYTVNETVLSRLVKKLNEYGAEDEDKIEILGQAINGSWKDFYELENKKNNGKRRKL